jgi:hypothetical protein
MLSLFYVESHSEFSPFGVEYVLVLSLFYVESHYKLSPFSAHFILSPVHSEFTQFGVESIRGWVHSGMSTFGLVYSGLS